MLKKTKITDDFQGTFTIQEIDGKTAYIFDTHPSLLYISSDGTSNRSHIFKNGKHIPDAQTLEIKAEAGGVVNYSLGFCAVLHEE